MAQALRDVQHLLLPDTVLFSEFDHCLKLDLVRPLRIFAEVFRRPPLSTQQILHPEEYFANRKPTQPEVPDPHLPHSYKGLVGGALGELEHGVLLEQFAGKDRAAEISPHWRGSNFELREDKKANRVVLVYAVATGFSAYYVCRAYPLGQRGRHCAEQPYRSHHAA